MEGTAELNRDTDGFIQDLSFGHTFLSMSLGPSGFFSPAVQQQKQQKLVQRGNP